MDLCCKGIDCGNVYSVKVGGCGSGFVGLIFVSWKCTVCGRWNFYFKSELDDVEVSI